MRKRFFLCLLLVSCFSIHALSYHGLTRQIENAYKKLDSIAYIENLILSYKIASAVYSESSENGTDLSIVLNRLDSIPRDERTLDSLWINLSFRAKFLIEENVEQFTNYGKTQTPFYVLNLKILPDKTLQVEAGKLPFDLFYFSRDYKGGLYIYCRNGNYSGHDTRYRTFSRQLGKNAPKVFRRIMRKQPDYLLYCSQLEGMNTILYMKNERIFVYRIIEMEEYELNEYLCKFKDRVPMYP